MAYRGLFGPVGILRFCLLSLLVTGCLNRPLEPVAPKWDAGLTLPVTNRIYTLADLVARDTNLLHARTDDLLYYDTRVEATPTSVGDRIRLNAFSLDDRVRLGSFGIGPVPELSLPLTLPGVVPGQPLPPVSRLSLPPINLVISQFREVTLRTGTLGLRLKNNLPVPLTVDSTVTLRDTAGNVITGFVFVPAQIPAGGEGIASVDCAGLVVPGSLTVANICLSEPGAPAAPPGDLVVCTLDARDLTVSHAVLSSIPPQILLNDSRFSTSVDDSNKIREVWIRDGSLTIQLTSTIPMNLRLRIRFDEMVDAFGRVYADSLIVPALGSATHLINLAGMRMRSLTGGFLSRIDMVGTVDLFEGSAGRPVTVSEDDHVTVHVTGTTMGVDSVVGAVKPTAVSINEAISLQLGDLDERFVGQIRIPAASLTFIPRTSIGFPLALDLSLIAKDALNNDVVLAVPPAKASAVLAPIEFPAQDVGTWLTRLSGNLPDTIRITGRVIVNPEYDTVTIGSLGRRSTFGGLVDLSVPMMLSLGGTIEDTVAFGDTTGDGNSDYRNNRELMESMNSGRLHFVLDNDIPVRGMLKVTLLDHQNQPVLTYPRADGDSLRIEAPAMAGGEVQATVRSARTFELSGEEIRALDRVQFVRLAISLATPGTGPVAFRSTGAIRTKLWTELSYRVNP